jgi:thiopurine S-methyltransferase
MDEGFWHQRWEEGAIGFHLDEPNPLVTAHFEKLQLAPGSRVFLPLCGKTNDIGWLLSQGYRVIGAELSRIAIDDLFDALGIEPAIEQMGALLRYRAPDIEILVGNIFEVSAELLGTIDAIYDRAALIALPRDMRRRYTAHLMAITHTAPQLLVALEYDQRRMDGPPFSVGDSEVKQHYAATYRLTAVDAGAIPGGIKGKVPAVETVWLLESGRS